MSLIRLPLRSVIRTPALSTSTRLLSTSNSLYSIRSQRQPGRRTLHQSTPLSRYRRPRRSAAEAPKRRYVEKPKPAPSRVEVVSTALQESASSSENGLVAPVNIPDDPHGVLKADHPAASILANSSIVVQRQIEMMNVFLGFEQANRYVIMDGHGNHIGYLAEKENGIGGTMARQMFKTHRSFTTHVFDKHEKEVLRFHRPFSFINTRLRVYDCVNGAEPEHSTSTSLTSPTDQPTPQISQLPLSDMRVIGEAQQQWAPLRRKYNLFLARDYDQNPTPLLPSGTPPPSSSSTALQPTTDHSPQTLSQFAYINEPFLSWDFHLLSADDRPLGSVSRNFVGFAREIFTDTGVYALRMDGAAQQSEAQQSDAQQSNAQAASELQTPGMTLDQRALMLATAVAVDFDYFSRHSGGGMGMGLPLPIWIPGMGGGAAAEGGAVGAAEGGAVAGTAGGGVMGAGEGVGGAAAGAGTMVGWEAMQGRRGGGQAADDGSPVAPSSGGDAWAEPGQGQGGGGQEEVWGEQGSPWDGWGGGGPAPPPGGGGGGGGGGSGGGEGGGGSWFDDVDFF